MPAMVSPRKMSSDSRRSRLVAEGVSAAGVGGLVVVWVDVAIYLGHASCRPCGDCRTGGQVIQVTAGQGKANPFLPRIFADERGSKAKAFTAKDAKERKEGRARWFLL